MTERRFATWLSVLTAAYIAVETVYIVRFPLIMDEFEGAAAVYRLLSELPYRDFAPYKTVLGYYLQLPLVALPLSTWSVLLLVKFQMAAMAAAALAMSAWLLRGVFDRRAITAALAMLFSMSTFLERSAELRVDMLTGAAGLLSLVSLLARRPLSAGVIAALSFLISQKGVIFFIAAAAGILLVAVTEGSQSRHWRQLAIGFAVGGVSLVFLYVAAWSAVAPLATIMDATFASAARQARLVDYSDIRIRYWLQTLTRNPLFYAFAIMTIVWLGRITYRARSPREAFLLGYSVAIAALAIAHNQPWPYFFVIILPVAFVIHAWAIDRVLGMEFPAERRRLLTALYLLGGLALPLTRLTTTLRRSNEVQRRNIEVAERILDGEDRYLAAVNMLFRRQQSLGELAWIDRTVAAELQRMSNGDLLMLVRRLHASRTKLVLYNYRIGGLPPLLRLYIESQYDILWGNILIYAPRVAPGDFDLNFSGSYVLANDAEAATIDGMVLRRAEPRQLRSGRHTYTGRGVIRLKLIPGPLPPGPLPVADFFPNVYDF